MSEKLAQWKHMEKDIINKTYSVLLIEYDSKGLKVAMLSEDKTVKLEVVFEDYVWSYKCIDINMCSKESMKYKLQGSAVLQILDSEYIKWAHKNSFGINA